MVCVEGGEPFLFSVLREILIQETAVLSLNGRTGAGWQAGKVVCERAAAVNRCCFDSC